MKKHLFIVIAALGLGFGASADTVALWDFNSRPSDANDTTGTLTPSIGSGLASVVGAVAQSFTTAAGSSDPAGTNDNSNWRITTFAGVLTGNKTRGVQFNLNTVGFENITAVWDQLNSATANKYWRVLYSVDNGATWVEHNVIENSASAVWTNGVFSADFTSIPGANNHTNFGVRLLAEFQSTATGSGAASYIGVGGTYGTGGTLRLDIFRFNGTPVANLTIFSQPSSLTVAVGQPASFSVLAGGGQTPIGYQWRFNSNAIPSATQTSYTISSAQLTNSGAYDVIITNATSSVTSSVVTLNVRTPFNLAWTGQSSPVWDESSVNWLDTASSTPAAYSSGDHTLFDVRGISSPQVNLALTLNPSSVTVDADFDYLLRSDVGGKIIGTTGLIKRGAGMLQIDTDNNYSGPTVIEAGALQLGVVSAHGSFGTGPVTNNAALVFNRSDTIVVANNITGTGSITNLGKTVTLTGTNVYNGDISVPSGVLLLNGNQTVNSPNVTLTSLLPTLGSQTAFGISGGISTSPSTALTTYGNNLAGDYRVKFYTTSGTNTWNGPIYLSGSAGSVVNAIQSDAASAELRINGDITAIDGFANALFFRGTGSVLMNGRISLPGLIVNKTDAGTWTLSSTGNDWLGTALVVGTLRVGTNDALPTALSITMGQVNTTATLDLNGFNQQVASVQDSPGSPGVPIITNSSAVSDSVLTLNASGGTLGALIKDGAFRKLGLTINSGSLNLRSNCTYSGATTLSGTLTLSGDGAITNSAVISLAAGSTLDASPRVDATLTLSSTQKLKGDGAFNIGGNLVNNGTIELKVNKSGATLTGDSIQGVNQLTYGGTLNLILSGDALAAGDSVKLFTATSYSSAFSSIVPAAPGSGLAWDTGTLATDGTLRVVAAAMPVVATTFLSGTDVVFNGTGGTSGGTYFVLSSTNVVAPVATWTRIQTNQFDASGNFSVTNAILPNVPQNFFLLQVP